MSKPLIELPSFPAENGQVPAEAVEAYERDGVVCLRNAFDLSWVSSIAQGMEMAIAEGVKAGNQVTIAAPGEPGFFFYDTFMWKRIDQFKQFAFESPAADLARQVMRSQSLIYYFDFMLVKEPGTSQKTPWHYDEAYWPIAGQQICNLWTAIDTIPIETALRFVRGSHRWTRDYRAVHFDPNSDYENLPALPQPPDWDEEPGEYELVFAPLSPGDCLIFHNRTHHSAPGNSLKTTRRRALATHWMGDDITYNDKPQETDPPYRGEGLRHGESMACESFVRVR